eukprot:5682620-Alexandrium_andersonii.AAC.1
MGKLDPCTLRATPRCVPGSWVAGRDAANGDSALDAPGCRRRANRARRPRGATCLRSTASGPRPLERLSAWARLWVGASSSAS